jgi:hypothetical protein
MAQSKSVATPDVLEDPRKPTTPGSPQEVKRWNTKNLGLRVAADATAAVSAATTVAPVITMIDQ